MRLLSIAILSALVATACSKHSETGDNSDSGGAGNSGGSGAPDGGGASGRGGEGGDAGGAGVGAGGNAGSGDAGGAGEAGAPGSAGGSGEGGSAGGAPFDGDYCGCVTGGDLTGTGYASTDCEQAGIRFEPRVHYCQAFDDASYTGAEGIVGEDLFVEWTDGSLDHEWEPNGGFQGGAAKFQAHTLDAEDDDGLFVEWPAAIQNAPQGNVGYLLYMGADWTASLASSEEWKHTLIRTNDLNGESAMLMEWSAGSKRVWSACSAMAGLCEDQFGEQYPNAADAHAMSAEALAEQWLYVELEHVPGPTGTVNLYVYTREGNVVESGPMADIPSRAATPHTFNSARVLAYLEGTCVASGQRQSSMPTCTDQSYAKIDLLKISDTFIGPPPGFVLP